MIPEVKLYKKWKKYLKIIHNEISFLKVDHHIFWQVQEIIKANPKIQKESYFYGWMGRLFARDMLIRIRRQIDLRTNDISLARLLFEIAERPDVLNWKKFESLYRGSTVKFNAWSDFKKFYGWKKYIRKKHINPAMVRSDLRKVKHEINKLKKYTDKKVAHWSNIPTRKILTFESLESPLKTMEKLMIKYQLIFNANNYSSLMPTFQYDWEAIFREPWIESSQ